ncbi:MAG: 50S ribosomal protein L29 [Candidatus Marsarchaeota archaeon]
MSLKAKELRKMKKEELLKLLSDQRLQLLKLSAEKASKGTLDKPGTLRVVKKNIARILTLLGENA